MEKGLVDASSFVDLCTLHQHAMRYYRLWIYASNIVIAITTFIFTLLAVTIFIDPRLSLLTGVELYQPTFIYAYIAFICQCGILQAIGCVGALRLNQKLLNIYWRFLFVLMIGDIFVGLVWVYKLEGIKSRIRPDLKQRLSSQYGNDSYFTNTWDFVQRTDVCCGVDGPTDFLRFNESSSSHVDSNGLPLDITSGFHHPKLPSTCCVFTISHHFPATPSPPSHTQRNSHRHANNSLTRSNRVTYPNGSYTSHLSSFGTSSGTHNRRKILHSTRKHETRGPDPSQHSHPHNSNVQTTTESSRRGTPFGVCGLPPELLAKYKNNIFIKVSDTIIDSYSFEGSGSGSSEEVNSHRASTERSPFLSSTATASSFLEATSTWISESDDKSVTNPSSTSLYSSTPNPVPQYVLVSMNLNVDGCGDKVLEFLDGSADILFVVGFCIIVFMKGCFLAILRYEIKEMIQKIKLLNGEDGGQQAAMNELIGLTSMYERGNEDPGEREGLMASSVSDQGAHETTVNTNIDAIESDNRKDSVISRDHVGNHVGNHRRAPNHIAGMGLGSNISSTSANTPPTTITTAVIVGCGPSRVGTQDSDEETGRQDLGRKFRNENGGRNVPRNGNNNTTGVRGSASAPIPIDSMTKV